MTPEDREQMRREMAENYRIAKKERRAEERFIRMVNLQTKAQGTPGVVSAEGLNKLAREQAAKLSQQPQTPNEKT